MFLRILSLSLVISGCAKIPDVSTRYYLTKSTLRLDVTRALSCSPGGQINISNAVSPVIANSADLSRTYPFNLQELKSTFTDPDVTVQFFEDGRLQSINATQTGTAKQIVESSLVVASSVLRDKGIPGAAPVPDGLTKCEYIEKHGDKNGILSLIYSSGMSVPKAGLQEIRPVGASKVYHERLFPSDKVVQAHIHPSDLNPLSPPVNLENDGQPYSLVARQLTKVSIRVHASDDKGQNELIWNGAALMALPGNEYKVPIPRRPAFGKQEFQVAFSESGSLKTLKYASTSGSADVIGLTGVLADELQGPSAADQAKALQAEADLIKQRERLAKCRANPSECQ
ncbi:hypothetical protein [Ruegeria meonggei]|uniref:Uncharacterized protein n=1 Tax=Ruegeria meonggei TaxID=1446476 RepID=A0A1X7ACX3_9RHOB|nr:hypothetical protein [Ruegeria meonggei]SLN76714.1 hypothetical protein RUM8411_04466 [Ruegeria meonggei]